MKRTLSLVAGLLLTAVSAHAQTTTVIATGGGGSPHVKSTWQMAGATIAIEYGRPSLKGRAESAMMPLGKPWRTGADAATLLTTDKALTFGTVTLQPGTYTINTQPGEKGWQLIFGTLKKAGQWGIPYQADLELGRAPMTLTRSSTPAEQVTFSIDHKAGSHALRLNWGTVSASTLFTVGK